MNNPSRLARVGWTKGRCLAALQPGTRVKLYVATSMAGGHLGYRGLIQNEKGELSAARESGIKAIDLDGVPDGYQPTDEARRQDGKATASKGAST